MAQIDLFRENGLGNMRQILLDLSRDPAMIHWIDNSENHAAAINENYGRELLELFSMGIGNYTEDDVKAAARAFTGWTFTQPIPLYPCGGYSSAFTFDETDHDSEQKSFLGQPVVDGEDVIDVIVKREACARFIGRHLYNFFVADEPQVPSWSETPPQDQAAVDAVAATFLESDGDIREVMRTLLNSDFFKAARFQRVKSPAEFVAGAIRLAGSPRFPLGGAARVGGDADGAEADGPALRRGLAHGQGMARRRHAHRARQFRGRAGDGLLEARRRLDRRARRRRR